MIGEKMDNFKKRQLYTMLNTRLWRVQKDLEELMKGLDTAVLEFGDYPEEQHNMLVLLRFEDGVAKTTEMFGLMAEDFRLRKELVELKLNIEKLADPDEGEEEKDFY